MLQLLISILLSFGMSTDKVDGSLKVNDTVIQTAKSNPEYSLLGGDGALNGIVITDSTDPK